jgi:hypothetical protein
MFLDKLRTLNYIEKDEWEEVKQELKSEFRTFLWYPSSGLDFRPMVFLNQKDTEKYNTPTIDVFFMSDYADFFYKKIKNIYNNFNEGYVIYEDTKTFIEITQIIPLNYFYSSDKKELNQKYNQNFHPSMTDRVVKDIDFYYMRIEIESDYFNKEYFHCFFSPMENWTLLKEVFTKENITFDYIWGIKDGVRKGGGYRPVNIDSEIVSNMKEKKYWVYDLIMVNENKYQLRHIDCFRSVYGYKEAKFVEII